VVVPSTECDRLGMHVANVEALRRALARLDVRPSYVLTDGFPVDGLEVPGLAIWKGDRVAACISAASVIAKVTRDRIMTQLHERFPAYDFATHKGYITEEHSAALTEHGPCPEHRMRFVNVRRAAGLPEPEPLTLEPELPLSLPELVEGPARVEGPGHGSFPGRESVPERGSALERRSFPELVEGPGTNHFKETG
jgi:ribonuclease HII